jgi:hypothetical protein
MLITTVVTSFPLNNPGSLFTPTVSTYPDDTLRWPTVQLSVINYRMNVMQIAYWNSAGNSSCPTRIYSVGGGCLSQNLNTLPLRGWMTWIRCRMVLSDLLRRVALIRTDVSEEVSASFIRVSRIDELGTTLKNGVFWVVTPCGSFKNRRFGGIWQRTSVASCSLCCS